MVRVIADKPPVLQRQVGTLCHWRCLSAVLLRGEHSLEIGPCCGWGREISRHGSRLPFCLCTCGESISLCLFSLKGTENCDHSTEILKTNAWFWCAWYLLCLQHNAFLTFHFVCSCCPWLPVRVWTVCSVNDFRFALCKLLALLTPSYLLHSLFLFWSFLFTSVILLFYFKTNFFQEAYPHAPQMTYRLEGMGDIFTSTTQKQSLHIQPVKIKSQMLFSIPKQREKF